MAFCTNCGAQIADGVKFCTSCGTPIGGAAAQAAPPPPPVRSGYTEIDLLDYINARNEGSIEEGKKFMSCVLFDSQSGRTLYFNTLDGDRVVDFELTGQAPQLKEGQKATIYYTKVGDVLRIAEIDAETGAAPPPANNTGADNPDYRQIDPYEFYLGRKKGKMQSGKFVMDLSFSDCDEEVFSCTDLEGDTEFTFEITKRPPELDSDDPITVYFHCEGADNPIIDNIVVWAKPEKEKTVAAATYSLPASASGANTAANIGELGREMADQLKNAAKEQLDKLNPLKGLFGKK
jgi:hypothetical protein